MTFVAHPYERFVDDLLTALTGGVIREEHLFTGIEDSYVLAQPDALEATIRVFGERGQAYAVFEPGIDYRFRPDGQAIQWEIGGRPPDIQSHFYVTYDVADAVPRLTDRNPGSVVSVLASGFAREFAVLHRQMQMIYESAFVDLATGSSLDHVAALLALTRRDARFAVGEVLFKRSTPAEGDIFVPPGTLVSTAEGEVFETTAGRTLRRGQLSIVVPIRAQVEGPSGVVEAGRITVANRPIFGLESVVNEQATAFATARETDEELRRRIRGTLERAGRSTLESIRLALVEQVPTITAANISVTEDPRQAGLVDIRIGGLDANDELIRDVEAAILDARAAGIRVRHNLAGPPPPVPATVATNGSAPPVPPGPIEPVSAAVGPGVAVPVSSPLPADRAPAATSPEEATLPLRIEILIALAKSGLSVVEREAIEEGVRHDVADYIARLPMGATLVYNKLLALILRSDEIADATLTVLLANAPDGPRYTRNLAAPDRKMALAVADAVVVELMQQRVLFDVRIALEPSTAADGEGAAGEPSGPETPAVPPALRDGVRRAIEGILGGSRVVARNAIREALPMVLAGTGFQLAGRDPVVLNARYEETGRLLDAVEEVALEEHELAALGELAVEPQEASDAQG